MERTSLRTALLSVLTAACLLCAAPAHAGTISGTVTQEGGGAVAGLRVDAYTGDPCGMLIPAGFANTDSGGGYSIDLPAGTYFLRSINGQQSNYVNEWWTGAGGDPSSYVCSDAQPVTLTTGVPDRADTDFLLEVGGAVSGRVTDMGGNPLAGVCVDAQSDACGGSWLGQGQTDGNGDYTIMGLPGILIYVSTNTQCCGLNYVNEWWNESGNVPINQCDQASSVALGATGVNFALEPAVTVNGTVMDGAGNPIDGTLFPVGVEVYSGDPCSWYQWEASASADAGGNFTISVAPGTYYLRSNNMGLSNYVNEWWTGAVPDPSGLECGNAMQITLNPGDTFGASFKLDQGGGVSGTVYEEDGVTPVAGMHVYATDYSTGQWTNGINTDEDGTYTLGGLPSGIYRIQTCASCSQLLYVDELYDDQVIYDDASQVVVTAPGVTAGIDFSLERIFPRDTVTLAIGAGVAWLAGTQKEDGSWGDHYVLAKTALSVLNLEKYAADMAYATPFHEDYDYRGQVTAGLDFIFANARTVGIGPQPAGDPDGDGDGLGVYFDLVEDENHSYQIYHTSIAMMAIAGSVSPARTVDVPGSPVDGWTYEAVLQGAVDYLAWAQTDSGYGRGGWNYQPTNNDNDRSDQSNSGWVTLAFAYAEAAPPEGFGLTVPGFVRSELDRWIDYIQDPVDGDDNDGGSYYEYPDGETNMLRAGNLLQQLAFVGETPEASRTQAAVGYVERHWLNQWQGSPYDYHTSYTVMKGLSAQKITVIDDDLQWFDELGDGIRMQQTQSGSWPVSSFDDGDRLLSTSWALLTLQKAVVRVEKPDLAIVDRGAVWVDKDAGTYRISVTVRNRGNVDAPAGHDVVLVIDDGFVEAIAVPVRAPGAEFTAEFSVVTVEGGTDAVVICADGYYEVEELNEDNNCAALVWPPSIEGTVTDGAAPVAGAMVFVVAADLSVVGTDITGQDGMFNFLDLPDGAYSVAVYAPGYYWQYSGGYGLAGQAEPVPVEGGTTPVVDFSLVQGGGGISGTVAYGTDLGREGTLVVLAFDAPTGLLAAMGLADGSGAYTIPGLPSGTYLVKARDEALSEWYQDKASMDAADGVVVSGTAVTPDIDFTFQGNTVSGAVYAADGEPLADVCVNAQVWNGQWMEWEGGSVTDEYGNYTITGLADGVYYLSTDVSCGGYNSPRNLLDEWWNGAGGVEVDRAVAAHQIRLEGGKVRANIDFALERGFHVTGSVMNVLQADGVTRETFLEIVMGNDFVGSVSLRHRFHHRGGAERGAADHQRGFRIPGRFQRVLSRPSRLSGTRPVHLRGGERRREGP